MNNPEDFRNPFSSQFRQKLADMAETILRFEERYAQIEKLASTIEQINPSTSGTGSGSIVFYRVASQPASWNPTNVACDNNFVIPAVPYLGTMFDVEMSPAGLNCLVPRNISENVIGYDLATLNEPDDHPAVGLTPDPLDAGTVVLAKDLEACVVFSSVMPRLSVEC